MRSAALSLKSYAILNPMACKVVSFIPPIYGIFLIGIFPTKSRIPCKSGLTYAYPLGLLRSEQIFAIILFGPIPALHVSFVALLIRIRIVCANSYLPSSLSISFSLKKSVTSILTSSKPIDAKCGSYSDTISFITLLTAEYFR